MLRWLLLAVLAIPFARAAEFDVVIRHGQLIDGSGRPAQPGDVAVKEGRIVALGEFAGSGRTEIDATGRTVAPGFIDVHTHAENLAQLPSAENFIRMGVTTIVTGNCGTSAPDVARFFAELTGTRAAVNVATLVGHGTLREIAMGGSFDRPPTAAELNAMERLVARAMQDGALGLSTGLIYRPGTFAKTDEIVALARVAAAAGGLYASHLRHENHQIGPALDELIRVAREAGIAAEVSHLKLSGPAAWGRAAEILARLDRCRAEGLRITHDVYVYTASSTSLGSVIAAEFRSDDPAEFRRRMSDPATKARAVAEMKESIANSRRGDFSYAVIASCRSDRRLNGKTIPQAARLLRGSDTLDAQIETILDLEGRGGAQAVFHGMNEADVDAFLLHPATMIGSDGGPRRFGEATPHPRSYGNAARVLAEYVRARRLLTLEEAVRKMTSLPARTFHLGDRGELRVGWAADLVIFDPAKVEAPSRYEDPHHYAVGFDDVLVNGVPVIRSGALTTARPGVPVRRAPAPPGE